MREVVKQLGLPNSVWHEPELQKYVRSMVVAGYVGSYARTMKTDKVFMKVAKFYDISHEQIAIWITSTSARHMMDGVERGMSEVDLSISMAPFVKDIPQDLKRWKEQ